MILNCLTLNSDSAKKCRLAISTTRAKRPKIKKGTINLLTSFVNSSKKDLFLSMKKPEIKKKVNICHEKIKLVRGVAMCPITTDNITNPLKLSTHKYRFVVFSFFGCTIVISANFKNFVTIFFKNLNRHRIIIAKAFNYYALNIVIL